MYDVWIDKTLYEIAVDPLKAYRPIQSSVTITVRRSKPSSPLNSSVLIATESDTAFKTLGRPTLKQADISTTLWNTSASVGIPPTYVGRSVLLSFSGLEESKTFTIQLVNAGSLEAIAGTMGGWIHMIPLAVPVQFFVIIKPVLNCFLKGSSFASIQAVNKTLTVVVLPPPPPPLPDPAPTPPAVTVTPPNTFVVSDGIRSQVITEPFAYAIGFYDDNGKFVATGVRVIYPNNGYYRYNQATSTQTAQGVVSSSPTIDRSTSIVTMSLRIVPRVTTAGGWQSYLNHSLFTAFMAGGWTYNGDIWIDGFMFKGYDPPGNIVVDIVFPINVNTRYFGGHWTQLSNGSLYFLGLESAWALTNNIQIKKIKITFNNPAQNYYIESFCSGNNRSGTYFTLGVASGQALSLSALRNSELGYIQSGMEHGDFRIGVSSSSPDNTLQITNVQVVLGSPV